MTTPGAHRKPGGEPRPAAGFWRIDPAQSRAIFVAQVAGQHVRGGLPLTGRVLIAEPIEDSAALLTAKASEVSTGSPGLDRLLGGPGFLDAAAFPEISFRSELLAWVPAGWRAVGRLKVKSAEHELACQLTLQGAGKPHRPPCFRITCDWVVDSTWVTHRWIPGLSRRISMTCSFLLEQCGPPDDAVIHIASRRPQLAEHGPISYTC